MKVVHVVRQFHPSIGGMEEVVLNVARQHQATSADTVEVVTLDRVFTDPDAQLSAQDMHQGLPIRRIGYRGSSRYPLAPSVLGAIRSADVVHLHGIDFFYDYLALTKPLHGKPMVVSTHGGFFHTAYASRMKQLWFQTLTRTSALAYARVIATSENDGDLFAKVVASARLRVIENGVDVEKYAGQGAAAPGRAMLYFGRWSVNKGLIETLELLQAALKRDPHWRLIIAGREYDLNEADLRKAIAERGLQDKVQLSMSPSQEQLRALMQQAQFFVCLSRHEGFGIAAVEAMSAGLIPILSDIPPFVRLASGSGQGVIVSRDRIEAAADQVQALALQSDSDFDTRRSASMAYVSRYDWKHVVGRYVDEYHDALGIPRVQEAVR
ncbi:glycosyltransferase family 4 protein [Xanthomonas axonopodis pv. vasculorum]|uniref:Glycosyl transferase family 1 n=1 Tax=Xanthomonas axonopodis pv. vasculorum TaxID=325777 RepID=A0A098PYV7_9XANT|nr:glycosyltransferase family 4 protein [Xanthomonas axonopodis]KGE51956.1 glycosyl transferase family 1 [Xanthomonas axonopodis pv. vasculorum]PPV09680.1 glycosyltransferase family 1 protein [Xanthomonas axonopodis pv. vasculorum]QKD87197.1 glycosyltransferase family 4 protein [Xanthomonas axonopodis pv. vasculorum]